MVLDVVNLTSQEMSFYYTDTKNIIIEAKESCRVPVPVGKCPLERLMLAIDAQNTQNNLEYGEQSKLEVASNVGIC